MLDVVTLGETMVLMTPEISGPLRYVNKFIKQIGGAESNFAIGIVRLGHRAGWISKLGNDEFGKYILSFIRGEGVDTSRVKFDPDAPTAVYFKERREYGESRVYYYRRGSAASRLRPEDLDPDYIGSAKYLHLTGITPALSESCYQTVKEAIKIAKSRSVKITFDPNIRLKLWSKERAREVIMELAAQADIVLPGVSEGEILVGEREPEKIAAKFLGLGVGTVVVKMGKQGAYYATKSESKFIPGFPIEKVVDPIGAGDGFAAGFVTGLLKGYSLEKAVRLANAVGAIVTTVIGDVEGLPTMDEVLVFMGEREGIDR
ncbi:MULTISPECIES: sugar kinase [Thermoanaerobacter]|uniref:PfkB domain protein n=2 Tax=Thermoanaerobacter TaxID=1754 RepID=B0KD80_THEP3|nr:MULTISPECIES: sugar kinase [Thermoanaerobacter]ABY95599.1 PfkB domain protein [Thermoanaerobacter pseudethanolicus ATCC 33223]ADV80537.1 PfkB domain protein [Thermoanaerobacter brockii subsp. finnii Ako-1]MDI3529298.1 2-dehydro-3-deoxygluconokinase [Thermoanaerobacter sp.]HBW60308.1 sugar kinase [Thermoanaerobacter sp.]